MFQVKRHLLQLVEQIGRKPDKNMLQSRRLKAERSKKETLVSLSTKKRSIQNIKRRTESV